MVDSDETLLKFPCEFPIKAIGRAREDLDAIVFSLVRPYVPDLSEGAIRTRSSRHRKYQSITITIRATSRAQLDSVYEKLTASEHIMVVL